MQSCAAAQSVVARHAPGGTQVSRKSQTKPPEQPVSTVHAFEVVQRPLVAQYSPAGQSPCVRQAVGGTPGTQTSYVVSQISPAGQSVLSVHAGAYSQEPLGTSQRMPTSQSAIVAHGQPRPTQYTGPGS